MWLLVFLFLIMSGVVGWTVFGYLLLVWFMGLFRHKTVPAFPNSWPVISVIVPCYNEETRILGKLENIQKLDYPRDCLEVVFADGGSQDKTPELLKAALENDSIGRVITCPCKGKVHQLNHVLPQLRGELILNTDADAQLSPDALKWVAAEFATAPDVWVVGAYCCPHDQTLDIERYYWDAQNKGRFLESDARSASIVIAQCYAFRRKLLEAFPSDVVADDIYVAFLAHSLGYRVLYSRSAVAVETRSPQTYEEFLPHKFRKSNAFLRESLRFLYLLPEMHPFCKMMLLTRTAQQLLLPWALLLWILIAGALLTLFRFDIVFFCTLVLLALFAITSRIFASVKLPEGTSRYSPWTMIKGYIFTVLIMLATGISYPAFKQGSSYMRLSGDDNTDEKN